jgi:shikimate kinase
MLGSAVSIDENLILTGYIGPGQLAIARRVAEALRMPFVDFQLQLEQRTGLQHDDIRTRYGEAHLKMLESEQISELILRRGAVIHVSGQTLLRGHHLEQLQATGVVVCIVASLDAVLQRLHLALGARYHNPRERDLALGMLKREWAIRQHHDVFELDTSYMTEPQMIDAIVALWREKAAVLNWRGV